MSPSSSRSRTRERNAMRPALYGVELSVVAEAQLQRHLELAHFVAVSERASDLAHLEPIEVAQALACLGDAAANRVVDRRGGSANQMGDGVGRHDHLRVRESEASRSIDPEARA